MMMNQTIHFIKMHGAGNDYIFVDTSRHPIENPEATSIAWSRNLRLFWGDRGLPVPFCE